MISSTTVRRGLVLLATTAAVGGVGTAVAAPAAHHHYASKTFHIHLAEVNGGKPVGLINGAVTGGGKDNNSHDQYDVAHLGGGTLRVNHPSKNATFHEHISPTNCFASFTEKGAFTINHGTGRFAGVHGSGTYVGHAYGILTRNKAGKCDDNAKPKAFIFDVNGKGTLK